MNVVIKILVELEFRGGEILNLERKPILLIDNAVEVRTDCLLI